MSPDGLHAWKALVTVGVSDLFLLTVVAIPVLHILRTAGFDFDPGVEFAIGLGIAINILNYLSFFEFGPESDSALARGEEEMDDVSSRANWLSVGYLTFLLLSFAVVCVIFGPN